MSETETSRLDVILKLIERMGFPAVISCALLYGLWIAADRVTTAHITTLQVVQDSIIRQATAIERVTLHMEANTLASHERTALLKAIMDEQKRTTEVINQIRKAP